MPKLKVYGWTGWRSECPPATNGSRQTREVLATTSKTKVREIAGKQNTPPLSEICDTGNGPEIEQAMTEPGVVFWCPSYEHETDRHWRS